MEITTDNKVEYNTTEERAKRILQLRTFKLNAQNELSNIAERLAPDRAMLDIEKANLDKKFRETHETDVIQQEALSEIGPKAEAEIRELVVAEYVSRDEEERKSKTVFPDLGVQVKKSRSIDGAYDHDTILEEVQEKYPTLITYDEKKLLKQSEVYDVVPVPNPVKDLEGNIVGPRYIAGIKEMPYIVLSEKVTAVVKSAFWEGGTDEAEHA